MKLMYVFGMMGSKVTVFQMPQKLLGKTLEERTGAGGPHSLPGMTHGSRAGDLARAT